MDPVEERLVHPFYLKMMGFNALRNADYLWDDLTRAGWGATEADVKKLLAPDHWRPVVMGSWFSLRFGRDQVDGELLSAIGRCRGSLTAPPLSVVAAVVIGKDAAPTLLDYIERDLEGQYGAAKFVAAVVEEWRAGVSVSPDDRDRSAFVSMLDVAQRLRSALTAA